MDRLLKTVVPERKVIRIAGEEFGTQETFGLYLDVKKQTRADVTALIAGITIAEAEQQEKLDNPVTRQLIDGRPTKPLLAVDRRAVLWFGNEFDLAMIRAIEKNLRQAIKRFLPRRVGGFTWQFWSDYGREGLDDIQSAWEWLYRPAGGTYRRIARSEFKNLRMEPGSKLILKPKDAAVGFLNHQAKIGGLKVTARRGPNAGQTRSDNTHGFMGYAIKSLKRSVWARNYSIYVTHTRRYQTSGDARAKADKWWSHGTPYITIVARMRTNKRGTYSRYRNVSEYRYK